MKNSSGGRVFHNFKKHEKYVINRLDNGTKKESRPEKEESLKHKEVNKTGRLWTF